MAIPQGPILIPTLPGRKAAPRKKDLWQRVKTILVNRLKERYGMPDGQAEIRAEMWLRVSPHQWLAASSEAASKKRGIAKVVAIR
jgi:hypothetical protein